MKRIEEIYESTVVEKDEHRKSKEYKKLSPKMKDAIDSIFNSVFHLYTPGPINDFL